MTWDLSRPIDADASVRLLTWQDDEGKHAYWHSSSHLMAEAVEALFPGAKFGVGPAIEAGFYYDIDLGDHSLTIEDLGRIEQKMVELSKRDSPYRREVMEWGEAVAYFRRKGDQYKLELLEGLKGEEISLYHHGGFTDLCSGPHIPSTGRIKAVKLLSVAGAYWRGSEKNKMLQRIYGITFPSEKELKEHLQRLRRRSAGITGSWGRSLSCSCSRRMSGAVCPSGSPKGPLSESRWSSSCGRNSASGDTCRW